MKKVFVILSAAVFAIACNSTSSETTTASGDTVAVLKDNDEVMTTDEPAAYKATEGDVTRRDGKLMVWNNGVWIEADKDQRLDDGVIVYRDGRVVKDDREMDLNDGEVVSKTGKFFDRTGRAIENAWDDTKRGVRKAGKAVGDAARKVGDKVEDAVDGKNN